MSGLLLAKLLAKFCSKIISAGGKRMPKFLRSLFPSEGGMFSCNKIPPRSPEFSRELQVFFLPCSSIYMSVIHSLLLAHQYL